MFQKITKYLQTHIDPELNKKIPHVLLGLSGGPDSVFLLYFFKHLVEQNKITLTAAHLNHGWRKESCDDEEFCKSLCDKLHIPLVIEHAKNLTHNTGVKVAHAGSLEEMGRKLRQKFFSQARLALQADCIALAHHKQDQLETFFIRLIRGTSLDGLTAIKPVQMIQSCLYIRPLLLISKKDILEYLHKNNILYVCDSTNNSNDFLRNRIRHQVIPALQNIDPRFEQKFETTLKNLTHENEFLQDLSQQAFKNTFVFHKNSGLNPPTACFIGNKSSFKELAKPLQKRVVIDWLKRENAHFIPSNGLLEEIIRFVCSERGGSHQITSYWQIKKQQKKFWIEKTGKNIVE